MGVLAIIATYIALDALITMHSVSTRYGSRHRYYQITHALSPGNQLTQSDFSIHELFAQDAPPGALMHDPSGLFNKYALAPGMILTQSMVAENAIESVGKSHRIVFVPTNEILDDSLSSSTDLLGVSSDGFSTEYLARNAHILFDISNNSKNDSHPGYFVVVTPREAENVIHALATGEVNFALRPDNH